MNDRVSMIDRVKILFKILTFDHIIFTAYEYELNFFVNKTNRVAVI